MYSMEATIEASRLEEQVFQYNYSLKKELSRYNFDQNHLVLDAGCGTGVLSRYLVTEFGIKSVFAFDYSDLRLKQAANFIKSDKERASIQFVQQNISRIDPEYYNKFDVVIARYVIEHVENATHVVSELKKTLKKTEN
ncbi:MAG: class I SAM-dependent methyltransferase [Bacteriovoracaceae bacterium]